MTVLYYVIVVVVAYAVGNWSNALFIAKCKKVDLRSQGSGNPGTMNMIRIFGKRWGAINLCLDILKGVLPALFGWYVLGGVAGFGDDKIGIYVGGISAIIGHIFPLAFRFKGGKGIASTIGVLLVVSPIATIVAFGVGAGFLFLTKVGSITSFIMLVAPLVYAALSTDSLSEHVLIMVLFMLTFLAHYKNIIKLFLDTERPVVLIRRQ